MTSPRRVPIFDGHNDVLLRLYRRGGTDAPRAFLQGEGTGQLDLPMACQGGFAGGLFAIFVPSTTGAIGPNGEARSQNVSSGAPLPPAVELMPAQRAVFAMVSLLLRIERALAVAIRRTGCDVAQERMSEIEHVMQPLAEEIIAAPVTSLGGLRAKALVALWEALPATASHQGAFDFPDASRSLFEAVGGMTDLLPLVRELEARLEADVESKDVDA